MAIIDLNQDGSVRNIKNFIDLSFLTSYGSFQKDEEKKEYHGEENLLDFDEEDEDSELVRIKLTVPQSQFLTLTDKFPLFVAGFGAGKSTTMIASILSDLKISNQVKIGAYCPTYDLLRLITAPFLQERLSQAHIPYRYNKQEQIMHLESGQQIILRSMDNPARIVGYQTFRAHCDELDTLQDHRAEDAWNKIIARNRQKIPMIGENGRKVRHTKIMLDSNGMVVAKIGDVVCHLNRVSAYTTPEGFKFCYRRWVKEKTPGYVYVQASTMSNPHNPPDYVDSLRATYPSGLIEAYIEGKFVNLTSGSVYPEFSRELNDTKVKPTFGEQIHVGLDFNVYNMAAAIFVIREDVPYMVDEISGGRDTETVCEILKERYGGKHSIAVYPDASGRSASSKGASISDITIIKRFGFTVRAKTKNPFIKDRVISVNGAIRNAKGEIHFYINVKNCPVATNGLEQQTWVNGLPDKAGGHDHLNDAIGYFIHWHWPVRKLVKHQGRAEMHLARK